jgi:hypothetical protein
MHSDQLSETELKAKLAKAKRLLYLLVESKWTAHHQKKYRLGGCQWDCPVCAAQAFLSEEEAC